MILWTRKSVAEPRFRPSTVQFRHVKPDGMIFEIFDACSELRGIRRAQTLVNVIPGKGGGRGQKLRIVPPTLHDDPTRPHVCLGECPDGFVPLSYRAVAPLGNESDESGDQILACTIIDPL